MPKPERPPIPELPPPLGTLEPSEYFAKDVDLELQRQLSMLDCIQHDVGEDHQLVSYHKKSHPEDIYVKISALFKLFEEQRVDDQYFEKLGEVDDDHNWAFDVVTSGLRRGLFRVNYYPRSGRFIELNTVNYFLLK